MANNPVLYSIYKIGKLMGDTGADINLPFLNVYGFGVDLNAKLSELMRAGAMAGGLLSSLGQIVAGGGGGISMKTSLKKMGIDAALDTGYMDEKSNLVKALKGAGIAVDENAVRPTVGGSSIITLLDYTGGGSITRSSLSSSDTSESGSVVAGNSSSEDIQNTTMGDAKNDANNQMAEAKESEDTAVTTETVNENVVKIYELLADVVDGNAALMVKLSYDSTYGLN